MRKIIVSEFVSLDGTNPFPSGVVLLRYQPDSQEV
jgi:hypothetical protein